jgi:hypothetical protein
MRRIIIIAAASAVVVALGITFQVVGTTSHDVKDGTRPSVQVSDAPVAPAEPTNDQEGKPGEAPKG